MFLFWYSKWKWSVHLRRLRFSARLSFQKTKHFPLDYREKQTNIASLAMSKLFLRLLENPNLIWIKLLRWTQGLISCIRFIQSQMQNRTDADESFHHLLWEVLRTIPSRKIKPNKQPKIDQKNIPTVVFIDFLFFFLPSWLYVKMYFFITIRMPFCVI